MSETVEELEQQARKLAAEDRARLVELLLESLHSPISEIEAAWDQEIENRIAAFDRGEMPDYTAEDVFAEARRLSR